jgi:ubiquinone/menaquinone biosynthesis C-methylase UbiE
LKLKLDHFAFLAPFYERFIQPRFPERLIALLDLPPGGVILDAGGGTGRVARYLGEKGGHVVVADISLPMLQEASKKTGLSPICSKAEALPFANESIDRIFMVDALHHVVDQAGTIHEFYRVLKSGGKIVVEEPDIRTFGVKLIALMEKLAFMSSHFLSPEEIGRLVNMPNAIVRFESQAATAWVVVEKTA